MLAIGNKPRAVWSLRGSLLADRISLKPFFGFKKNGFSGNRCGVRFLFEARPRDQFVKEQRLEPLNLRGSNRRSNVIGSPKAVKSIFFGLQLHPWYPFQR
jgi:hypothetical protein